MESRLLAGLVLALLITPAAAQAFVWTETDDAGEVPFFAQVPVTTPGTPSAFWTSLDGISGVLGSDTDMFLIQIDDVAAFQATTVGGATFDTQLWLFDEQGYGVVTNDDALGILQSTIVGSGFVRTPGRYYLAISPYNRDPIALGADIWGTWTGAPIGPSRLQRVDGWSGTATSSGAYTISLTGASFPQWQVVCPRTHHLMRAPDQTGNPGSTSWWRQSGGRFQIHYEGSHFYRDPAVWLSPGSLGGHMRLERLLFRGEDGEPNPGGQSWSGVQVRVGTTTWPFSSSTLGADFAANLASPGVMMGPVGVTTVTVQPAVGSTPNNYNIVIDLVAIGAAIDHQPGFTPSSPGGILIDITMPSAAAAPAGAGPVMAFQDAVGPVIEINGSGVSSANPLATVGTVSPSPLVVGMQWRHAASSQFGPAGQGGDAVVVAARNETIGAACGGAPSTFYQSFVAGQRFDLIGLTLMPNVWPNPSHYVVTAGAPAIDYSQVNATPNSTADDAVVQHVLGFSFSYPGAATGVLQVCTNGYLWLDATQTAADASPTTGELLGATTPAGARLLPCWYDFHAGRNVATHPNAGLHVRTDASGGAGNARCFVTWHKVGVYDSMSTGGVAVHDVQCVLHQATGVIEFRYGAMPTWCSNYTSDTPCIVGFTRGRIAGTASVDPWSRDLSTEVPFATSTEGARGHMGLRAVGTPHAFGAAYGARMFQGQSLTWNVENVPPGSVLGCLLLDLLAVRPGLQIPTITAPGCMASVTPNALFYEVHVFVPPTVIGTVPLPIGNTYGFDGVDVYAQYVVLDGLFGAPDLVTVASNTIRHTHGWQ